MFSSVSQNYDIPAIIYSKPVNVNEKHGTIFPNL